MAPAGPAEDNFGLWAGLRLIYGQMPGARRRQFFLVLGLMLAGAASELATIGAVVPFIALLASSGRSSNHGWPYDLAERLWGHDALAFATSAFILFATIGGLLRLQLAWSIRSFAFNLGHDLSVDIQCRLLSQPYSYHTARNSSTLLSALNKTEMLCFDLFLPLMHALTSAVIALSIVAVLLLISPLTTISSAGALLLLYLLIASFSRPRLEASSAALANAYDGRLQVVQESLGGIRDVIIDDSKDMYVRTFEALDSRLNAARTMNQFFIAAPRYLIEMGGMVVIAGIAFASSGWPGGMALALPFLAALALGAQRLLPLLHQVYAGWSAIAGHRSIFRQVAELLELRKKQRTVVPVPPLEIGGGIALEKVGFSYPGGTSRTIDGVSLSIPRGSMLGLTGETGSGKSTLLDLIMGLLEPDCGTVNVNGRPLTERDFPAWHRSIAHVPQSIFLIDSTLSRNIALSRPDEPPDSDRILEAASKAQLHGFIASLPAGYETRVGERGIRLSGGQRQRLGLARAIYKDAPVIILDEATSALDEETERAVMLALDGLWRSGRTMIVVAHRASTLRHCNRLLKLERGRLVATASGDGFTDRDSAV